MTGVTVTIDVRDYAVRGAFDAVEAAMHNPQPMMEAIGDGLVSSTHMRFVTQSGPDGASWTALNPAYARGKRNTRILTESGRLRDSITSEAARSEVRVGTNVVYGAIHQLGGTIRPKNATHLVFQLGGVFVRAKSVTIPARPFLGISADDEQMIAEIVQDWIERHVPS
jgi:phage virion morphogenesis protein